MNNTGVNSAGLRTRSSRVSTLGASLGARLTGALLASAVVAACGAPPDQDSIEVTKAPIVCGTNDRVNVELFTARDRVPSVFVMRNETAVAKKVGGCTGTLIDDGRIITAGHCVSRAAVGDLWYFNFQLDPLGAARQREPHWIAEIIEDRPVPGNLDFAVLRFYTNPQNRWGANGFADRPPVAGETIVNIGHPKVTNLLHPPKPQTWKTVDTGTVESFSETRMIYRGIDTAGSGSGSALIVPLTGDIIGIHSSGTSCDGEVGNVGTPSQAVLATSTFIHDDEASVQFRNADGEAKWTVNWSDSRVRHFAVGRFDRDAFEDLFAVSGGFGTIYRLTDEGAGSISTVSLGASDWTQVVPIELDGSGTTEVLIYSARTGFFELWGMNGAGKLARLRRHTRWSKDEHLMVSGDFAARAGQEILSYSLPPEVESVDRGTLTLIGTTADGMVQELTRQDFVSTYSIILAGEFATNSPRQEVMVYDSFRDEVIFYDVDDSNRIVELARHSVAPVEANIFTQVVAGDFVPSSPGSELFFYAALTGETRLYTVRQGQITEVKAGVAAKELSRFVAGKFTSELESEIFVYDRHRSVR